MGVVLRWPRVWADLLHWVIGPHIQASLFLSHTEWGTIYMAGTLLSALILPRTGAQIDRFSLTRYPANLVILVLACAVMATATSSLMLLAAIFLLRHSGQGLMNHIAITTVARRFHAERGRAIAITTLGMVLGEAVLPVIAVGTLTIVGWRGTYASAAILLTIVVFPIVVWLLQSVVKIPVSDTLSTPIADTATASKATLPGWTRRQVLRDVTFYLLLPGVLAPAIIVTAMFFHHLNLADAKGWSHTWITGNYIFYAVTAVATTLVAGPLIDRLGAVRLTPFMLVPLAAALMMAALFNAPWVATAYLILAGVSSGISQLSVGGPVARTLWRSPPRRSAQLSSGIECFRVSAGPAHRGRLNGSRFYHGIYLYPICLYCFVGTALISGAKYRPHIQEPSTR
ncbi:MAG: hypothetical protein CM1200mP41_03510 [Gammaproteobacteria bacterium]|nr:MAG: hypothetical protein CM1200mP41_03510 [Gammaproteobacteria bacterium]